MADLVNSVKVKYYSNQLLNVADFDLEQKYHIEYRNLLTSLIYTEGVVQGLDILATSTGFTLSSGLALKSDGQFVLLVDSISLVIDASEVNTFSASNGLFTINTNGTIETHVQGDPTKPKYQGEYFLFLEPYEVAFDGKKDQSISSPKLSIKSSSDGDSGVLLGNITVSHSPFSVVFDKGLRKQSGLNNPLPQTISASDIKGGTLSAQCLPTFTVGMIPDLSADKINSGQFTPDRLPTLTVGMIPDLSADKINSGQFNIDRIPIIPADKIQSYSSFTCDNPVLNGEQPVTLQWNIGSADSLKLDYAMGCQIESLPNTIKPTLNLQDSYTFNPWASTVLTLTATKGGKIVLQQQLSVTVIQTAGQFIKQLSSEGLNTEIQLEKCADRFNLNTLSKNSVTNLSIALKYAGRAYAEALSQLKEYFSSIGQPMSTTDAGYVQAVYGQKPASLSQFVQQEFNQTVPLDTSIKNSVTQFNLNLDQSADAGKLALSLKNAGYTTSWDILSSVMKNSSNANKLNDYVPIASALSLYTPETIYQYISTPNNMSLIEKASSIAFVDFRKEVYSTIFTPAVKQFPSDLRNYWFFCVCDAFRKAGVSQKTTGFCLSSYFEQKGWSYPPYVLILINVFNG